MKKKTSLLWMTLLLPLSFNFCSKDLNAGNPPDNPLIYRDDKLTDRKLIIAHHMTKNNPFNYRQLYDSARYGTDKPYRWDVPTFAFYTGKLKSLEEFIEWEIRAAKKLGLDGFEMFYPHNAGTLNTDMATYDKVIIAYLKVIEEKKLDFKITLSLSHPNGHKSTEQLATEIAGRLKKYFDAVPNSRAWMRTPEGRYLWHSFGLDEIVTSMERPFYTDRVEDSYAVIDTVIKKIEQKAGINIALVYHLREVTGMKNYAAKLTTDPKAYYVRNVNAIYDHFAGVSGFADVIYDESLEYWNEIFRISKERRKTYYQSIFLDYGKVRDYLAYLPSKGSWHVQKLFEQAISLDCDIIRVMTWNDYPESHHLQPGMTHNFGFGILINWYKNIWNGEPRKNNEDIAIVFTKKYNPVLEPSGNNIRVAYFTHILPDNVFKEYLAEEDKMNIVTLLTAPGDIFLNDVKVGTGQKGLTSLFVPLTNGPVHLTVKRNNKIVVDFTSEEWITEEPLRTDVVTYTFSSKFIEYYNYIFDGYFNGFYYTSRDYNHERTKPGDVLSPAVTETGKASDDEMIDVGFGKRSKRTLSTPVSETDMKNRKFSSYSDMFELIKCEVSGVRVAGTSITVLGPATFGDSNEPLIVVDGVAVSGINDVVPSDVSTISLLRGSDAAIYGMRGANGVILITTVRGSEKR